MDWKSKVEELARQFGRNRILSELYLRPDDWKNTIRKYRRDEDFLQLTRSLIPPGLLEQDFRKMLLGAHLTELGIEVAKAAEAIGILFAQMNVIEWRLR